MSAKRTIKALLEKAYEAAEVGRGAKERQALRIAWVKQTMAKIRAADKAVDEAWNRLLDEMEEDGIDPDEADDPPVFPEEEVRDALMAQVEAVRDHDRWPKALYWGGI